MKSARSETVIGNARIVLADRVIEHLGRFAVVRDVFYQRRPDSLEKANGITDTKRLVMRHRQRKGFRQLLYRLHQPFLAPLLRENEFLPSGDHRNPLLCRSVS